MNHRNHFKSSLRLRPPTESHESLSDDHQLSFSASPVSATVARPDSVCVMIIKNLEAIRRVEGRAAAVHRNYDGRRPAGRQQHSLPAASPAVDSARIHRRIPPAAGPGRGASSLSRGPRPAAPLRVTVTVASCGCGVTRRPGAAGFRLAGGSESLTESENRGTMPSLTERHGRRYSVTAAAPAGPRRVTVIGLSIIKL